MKLDANKVAQTSIRRLRQEDYNIEVSLSYITKIKLKEKEKGCLARAGSWVQSPVPSVKQHTEDWLAHFPSRKERSLKQIDVMKGRKGQVWVGS